MSVEKIKKWAFTTTELVIVIGIISIMVQLTLPAYRRFHVAAFRSEVKTNLNLIHAMQESYLSAGTNYFDGHLTGLDFSGPTTCRNGNALGFSLNNCKKSHYRYSSTVAGGISASLWGQSIINPDGQNRVFYWCNAIETSLNDLWRKEITNTFGSSSAITSFSYNFTPGCNTYGDP